MKKSYLFLLLCLLFGCQMCVLRPNPPDPCGEVSYKVNTDTVYWDVDSMNLMNIIDSMKIYDLNLGSLPQSFNVVIVQLTHPTKPFKEYSFDISVEQSGSSEPIVLLFVHGTEIEITPEYNAADAITGFKVKNTYINGGGGVVTAAHIDILGPSGGKKCVNILTVGKQLVFENEQVCLLNHSNHNFCTE